MDIVRIHRNAFLQLYNYRLQCKRSLAESIAIDKVKSTLNSVPFNYPKHMCQQIAYGIVTHQDILMCNCEDTDSECERVNEIGRVYHNTEPNTGICITTIPKPSKNNEHQIFDIYPPIPPTGIISKSTFNFDDFLMEIRVYLHNFAKCAFNATIILLDVNAEMGLIFENEIIPLNVVERQICDFLTEKENQCPMSVDLVMPLQHGGGFHISMIENQDNKYHYIVSI